MIALLELWTDGSGTLADGPACIGVAIFDGPRLVHEEGEYVGQGTNNYAELRAIRRALHVAKERFGLVRELRIVSDSEYALAAVRGDWRPTENAELIYAIRKQVAEFVSVEFEHVDGHAGVYGNELADYLAGSARVAWFAALNPPRVKPPKKRPEPADGSGPRCGIVKAGRARKAARTPWAKKAWVGT